MDPIIKYLEIGEPPFDQSEAFRLSTRAAKFTLVDGKLYIKGFCMPLQRCLTEEKTEYVMKERHERVCGTHIGGRALSSLVVRQVYFWPTMK